MKKILLIAVLGVISFACVSKKSADRVQSEKDSLANVVLEKDVIIEDVFTSLNLISENLDNIKNREKIVTAGSQEELTPEIKTKIQQDIIEIDKLLVENRTTIESLKASTARLKQAKIKIGKLENLIASLNRQVESKDGEIASLKSNLESLDIKVADLEGTVEHMGVEIANLHTDKKQLENRVNQQTEQLNTAYYIISSEEKLLADGIVVKSGFVRRSLKINGRYDLDKFNKINIGQVGEIEVGQKKITVVSSHPEDSYQIKTNDKGIIEKIIIVDANRFWESSKILVVAYK